MFDTLCGGNESGVEDLGRCVLAEETRGVVDHVVYLSDQSLHLVKRLPGGLCVQALEDDLQSCLLTLCLFEKIVDSYSQSRIRNSVGKFRQRVYELRLSAVQVAQLMQIKVLQVLRRHTLVALS
jgi:hypothetical protein